MKIQSLLKVTGHDLLAYCPQTLGCGRASVRGLVRLRTEQQDGQNRSAQDGEQQFREVNVAI